ncbi:MAG: hypothetical protein ACXW2U_05360 [Telluria sp.]
MRFFEQILKDGRLVLSPQIEPDADRVMRDADAPFWLEAKRQLGYMLSAVQEVILDESYRKREAALAAS